jgi:hypothetical protein
MTENPEQRKEPFIIRIQPKVLSDSDAKIFTRLLSQYIEKTGAPPPFYSELPGPSPVPLPTPTPRPIPNYTLSNCRDTETECTCDRDDERP